MARKLAGRQNEQQNHRKNADFQPKGETSETGLYNSAFFRGSLMMAYGLYIVSREIHESSAGNDSDSKERIRGAIWLVANYYRCSFNGKLTDYYRLSQNIEKWNSALWELRAKYGTEMMNKAMFIATQQWKPFGSIEGDVNFNNYYSLRILAGIKALDNNAEDPAKDAQSFLEQRGLYTPNAQK